MKVIFSLLCVAAATLPQLCLSAEPSKVDNIDALIKDFPRSISEGVRNAFLHSLKSKKGDDAELIACWVDFIEANGLLPGAVSLDDVKMLDVGGKLKVSEGDSNIRAVLSFAPNQLIRGAENNEVRRQGAELARGISKFKYGSWTIVFEFEKSSRLLKSFQLTFGWNSP